MNMTMSILGLFNWNISLFDDLVLPPGIDRDILVDNLCMELAEFEVLYADPIFMKRAIKSWSLKELPVWTKYYETTIVEYNPIHNYDRTEEWKDNTKSVSVGEQNSTGSGNTNNTGTDKVKNSTGAFNDNNGTMTPVTATDTILGTGSVSSSVGNARATGEQNTDNVRTGRAYGNIGVMSTQQMLEQERNIASFNMMDYIIDSFKNRFCILVY